MICMRVPLVLLLVESNASVRSVDIPLLIGSIELISGINKPSMRAIKVARHDGTIEGE